MKSSNTITSFQIYELFYTYMKSHPALMNLLFDSGDNNTSCLYFVDKTGKIKYLHTPRDSYPRSCFVKETGDLQPRWKQAILNCDDVMFHNIEKVIDVIFERSEQNFNNLQTKLNQLCKQFNLTKYIPAQIEGTKCCVYSAFILFMYSIGYDLNSSPYLKNEFTLKHEEERYFPQYLYNANSKLLDINNFNMARVGNYKHFLIEGPGGQGKSRFITELKCVAKESKFFSYVYSIELRGLIHNIEKCIDHKNANDTTSFILDFISEHDSNKALDILTSAQTMQSHRKARPMLLLLDGYNEIFVSPSKLAIKLLTAEIEHISTKWDNTYIFITSRFNDIARNNTHYTSLQTYQKCLLSGVPHDEYSNFINKHSTLPETIKELAKIPMYFKHLVLHEDTIPQGKYDLLYQMYYKLFKQTKCNAEDYFAFFIAAPHIAQYMNDSCKYYVSHYELTDYVNCLTTNLNSCEIASVLHTTNDSDIYTFSNLKSEKIINALTHKGPLTICDNNGSLGFFHDDIREFLVAFSVVCAIQTHTQAYQTKKASILLNSQISMNISADASNLLKEILNLSFDVTKGMEELYSPLLTASNFELNETSILYAHTAFLISDYLQIPFNSLKTSLHKILSKITEECCVYYRNNMITNLILSFDVRLRERCLTALANIFSKECEYYRRDYIFPKALELIKIAESICLYSEVIVNQKAKIYLYYHKHLISEGTPVSTEKLLGFSSIQSIFNTAMQLLEDLTNKSNFNLSSNSIGMLYSVPAPYLVREVKQPIDFIKAFWANYNTITTKHHVNYIHREIDYTVRQAVALLLKGYVRIKPGFLYRSSMIQQLTPECFALGEKNPLMIDNETLKFADDLLKFADGQYINSLNYLRALVSYYQNHDNTEALLLSEDDNLLNQLFLNYKFLHNYNVEHKYQDLIKCLHDPQNQDGRVDGCHQIYWYCDAKNLEIALNPDCKEKFEVYERDFSDVYKMIVGILTSK